MKLSKSRCGKIFLAVFSLVSAGQCLAGCAMALPAGVGNGSASSYFTDYTSRTSDGTCTVTGHVKLHTTDAGVTRFTAGEDSEITVVGKVKDTEGDIRLVYMAPDGTETVISEGENRKIDETVAVAEGEGAVCFTGDGRCDFSLKIKAGESVTFESRDGEDTEEPDRLETVPDSSVEIPDEEQNPPDVTESLPGDMTSDALSDFPEIPETPERSEALEIPEISEIPQDLAEDMISEEEPGFPGVTDNWPESILLEDEGMTAQPLYISFRAEEAMKVSLSCTTTGGSLHIKIANGDTKKIYFDEKDPKGSYDITIDEPGNCYLIVYAQKHKGSIRMAPVEQLSE